MNKVPFSYEQPEQSPGFLLWQVTVLWQRKIKGVLAEYQVTHSQFVIMATLLWLAQTNQTVTQILLIENTKLDKMTVSNSVKDLLKMGFVTRVENILDARAKVVKLTQKGEALVYKLVPIVESVDKSFFARLEKKEEQNFIKYLSCVIKDCEE